MTGTSSFRPVLVLHSAGLDRESVRFLSVPGVHGVDLQGHGANPSPATTVQAMADEVAAQIDAPVDIVGLSLGGMVAQHVALRHPHKVRSLLLGCTTAYPNREAMLDRALLTEQQGRDELVSTTLERWFSPEALGSSPEPEGVRYAKERLEQIDQARFAAVWRAIATHDVRDIVSSITAPTTCLAGSGDVSTPPEVVRALHRAIRGSRYVEMAAPHMAYLEDPRRFSQAVLEHLDWAARFAGTGNEEAV